MFSMFTTYTHALASAFAPDTSLSDFHIRVINGLQTFAYEKLPKIAVIAVLAWVLTRVLKAITNRIVRVTERHAASTARPRILRG